jgi:transposase
MMANSENNVNESHAGGVQFCIMNWIQGSDRHQDSILPPRIEDYVAPNNPVRFIDAFVDQLDLRALGFIFPKENLQNRGRPAYQPSDLLKLYLYGYLHLIRASRRLQRECARNLEVIWLLRELKPDFKTIADFRKDNAAAFKAALRQFNQICRQLELFGGELLAVDGTKIKGQNSPAKNWSVTKLEKQRKRLDQHLEEYVKALDQADEQEQSLSAQLDATQLEQKIQQLKGKKLAIEAKLHTMETLGQTQLSATDPESRSMKTAQGYLVGYNVQGAVDAKHHLLVSTEVTNACVDQGQLVPPVQAAKAELQITRAEVLADGGYYCGEDIKACQELGLEVYLPPVNNSPSERAGLFGKKDFRYDPATDSYRCPAGQPLTKRREMLDNGRRLFNYDHPQACASCPLKSRCTQAPFRTVSRWEHEESLERMAAKVAAEPEKLARRKTLIEHCWGTLKWMLPGGFLLKGIKKAGAELSLVHFAYNFKRALKVVGLTKLMAALKACGWPGPRSPQTGPTVPPQTTPAVKSLLRSALGGLRCVSKPRIKPFFERRMNIFEISASKDRDNIFSIQC